MTVKKSYIRVGKSFLKGVFDKIKYMRQRISDKTLSENELSSLEIFDKVFDLSKRPKDFFKHFYYNGLMRSGSMNVKGETQKRVAKYILVLYHLRTLFLGILSGNPKTGFLSRRLHKYHKAQNISNIFEEFIKIYRTHVGFKRIHVPKHILISANITSKCNEKPIDLCLPPTCQYIHPTRKSKGYCRTKTRKIRKYK